MVKRIDLRKLKKKYLAGEISKEEYKEHKENISIEEIVDGSAETKASKMKEISKKKTEAKKAPWIIVFSIILSFLIVSIYFIFIQDIFKVGKHIIEEKIPPNGIIQIDPQNEEDIPEILKKPESKEETEEVKETKKTEITIPPQEDTPEIKKSSKPDVTISDQLLIIDEISELMKESKFSMKLWCPGEIYEYSMGDLIDFYIYSEKEGYLFLFDIYQKNAVKIIFPNKYESDIKISKGVKKIPGDFYGFGVTPKAAGNDIIVAIVTSSYIDFTGIHDWDSSEIYRKLNNPEIKRLKKTLRELQVVEKKENLIWSVAKIELLIKE